MIHVHLLLLSLFCFHCGFSLIPWYSSIDPELTSVKPKGQIPLRLNLHYVVYPSTDCTMNGCAWIGVGGGNHSNFNLQIWTSLQLINYFVPTVRVNQVPFCNWNIHDIFVASKTVNYSQIIKCIVKNQNLLNTCFAWYKTSITSITIRKSSCLLFLLWYYCFFTCTVLLKKKLFKSTV